MKIYITLLTLLTSSFISFSQGIVTTNGLLKTNGNRIVNKDNVNFSMAGNSMFWSGFGVGSKFYTSGVVDHLATDWDIQVIRAAIAVEEADGGQGYVNNPEVEYARLKTIIDAAIANDIYVIVDFHSHFADLFESQAIDFFTRVATDYGDKDNIIYEIFNEPISVLDSRSPEENQIFSNTTLQERTWDEKIKPYSLNVIKAIRALDKDNLIIVGTPGFSQFVNIASTASNRIKESDFSPALPSDAILNIAYTLHFYSGTHSSFLRQQATTAMNNGVALFVTEWGTVNADGNGAVNLSETREWLSFMKNNGISHANWAVNDKAEGASVVTAGQGISGLISGNLTDSGNLVRCIIKNWNSPTDEFLNCTTSGSTGGGGTTGGSTGGTSCGSGTVPTGVGTKVEVETTVGQTDAGGARSDFRSTGLSTCTFGTEGALTGFVSGEAATFNLPITNTDNYTIQAIVSSNGSGNTLRLERDSGTTNLGSVAIPDTGGLEMYQKVNISGVPFSSSTQDIALAMAGSGSINIESFYYATDADVLDTPDFEKSLADKISIYPNPITSEVFISSMDTEEITYSIFNVSGKELVANRKYTGRIKFSEYSKGLYLLKLYRNSGEKIFKLVKK